MKNARGYGSNPIHSMVGTPTYFSWAAMIQRCYDPKKSNFKWYGGCGISVIPRWRVFKLFFEDMGVRPEGATLSRIDNNGNYELSNCKWETSWKKQVDNRRNTHWLVYQGERMTLKDFAKRIGVVPPTLYNRIAQGWSVEQIVARYGGVAERASGLSHFG